MPPRNDTVSRAAAMLGAGQAAQAEALLRSWLARSSRDAAAKHLLGLALAQLGKADQAEYFLIGAARDDGARPEYHAGLGNFLAMANRHSEAAAAFRAALERDPGHAAAHVGLALALMKQSDFQGAEGAAREACRLQPGIFQPYVNLASVLTQAGRASEALDVLRDAKARFPQSVPVHTSLLVTMNYAPDAGDGEMMAAVVSGLGALLPSHPQHRFTNTPDPERRLRIGYISGDLRTHSVAYFLEPILAAGDTEGFESWCYSTTARADGVTARLRSFSGGWVDAANLSADALAARMRADGIDIAVDLSGHTSGSRVMALAQRAAPVQATYLGYPASTGLPAIDYRIVDSMTDPAGAERFASERLVRLDPCFLCYGPPADAPEAGPPPSDGSGRITFGSFNSMPKLSPAVIAAWSEILKGVNGSRLVMKNRALADANLRARIGTDFAARDVDPGRLELLPPTPTLREHLGAYAGVDIALDTFPYNGTTTTCEALWMGVPVVSLVGARHAGRVGLSLLSAAGLGDLAAATPGDYVRVARELAGDGARLHALRSTLRDQMNRSALCDSGAFAARLGGAYRGMWRAWCAGAGVP